MLFRGSRSLFSVPGTPTGTESAPGNGLPPCCFHWDSIGGVSWKGYAALPGRFALACTIRVIGSPGPGCPCLIGAPFRVVAALLVLWLCRGSYAGLRGTWSWQAVALGAARRRGRRNQAKSVMVE